MQVSELLTCLCVSLCTSVVRNIAENSYNYFSTKPLDNRHNSLDKRDQTLRHTTGITGLPTHIVGEARLARLAGVCRRCRL